MYRGDERQNAQDTNKRSITNVCFVNRLFTRFLRQTLDKPKKTRGRWIRACKSVKSKQGKKYRL